MDDVTVSATGIDPKFLSEVLQTTLELLSKWFGIMIML